MYYCVPEAFWSRNKHPKNSVYVVHWAGIPTSRTGPEVRGAGPPSWWFTSATGTFSAFAPDGNFHRCLITLEELIDYLESTGRSEAVDNLQIFCEDASLDWPPALDMDCYLASKDSIWDRFSEHRLTLGD